MRRAMLVRNRRKIQLSNFMLRPPFLKSPTHGFFFASTEITGGPRSWHARSFSQKWPERFHLNPEPRQARQRIETRRSFVGYEASPRTRQRRLKDDEIGEVDVAIVIKIRR